MGKIMNYGTCPSCYPFLQCLEYLGQCPVRANAKLSTTFGQLFFYRVALETVTMCLPVGSRGPQRVSLQVTTTEERPFFGQRIIDAWHVWHYRLFDECPSITPAQATICPQMP